MPAARQSAGHGHKALARVLNTRDFHISPIVGDSLSLAMTVIREADVIASVADALQYISYYHSPDFIRAMGRAYEMEQSPSARDAIAQILTNSRMCAEGHRPICQDTGIVVVFVKVGMGVRWQATLDLEAMINEGVRQAYLNPDNKLRASIVSDPAFKRVNTRDNTPAVIHTEFVPGEEVEITVAAKGGGSENKAMFAMLNPSDSVADWVLDMVPEMGAGWCPPGMLGVGIGGSAEKAMLLAKKSLMDPIDIGELIARGPGTKLEELRLEIFQRVNALGLGAQGLGGLTTVLDVKILDYPTHAASLPAAVIPNCAATRHIHFTLDGSGPALLEPPDLKLWPKVQWAPDAGARRVSLDGLDRAEIARWKPGERLLLSGKLLTGRDAAHKRICALLDAGQPLPGGLGFSRPRYLLRRTGGSRRYGSRGTCGADHRQSHGSVHRHHAGQGRTAGDGRQGRARSCRPSRLLPSTAPPI